MCPRVDFAFVTSTRGNARLPAKRSVALKAELNHLAFEYWLAVNKPQLCVGLVLGFGEKIIAQAGCPQARDGEAFRDTHNHFA